VALLSNGTRPLLLPGPDRELGIATLANDLGRPISGANCGTYVSDHVPMRGQCGEAVENRALAPNPPEQWLPGPFTKVSLCAHPLVSQVEWLVFLPPRLKP
jgi:hypothetical protein